MVLKLVGDNKKALLEQVADGVSSFQELENEQQSDIIQLSLVSGDFRALQRLTNELTGIYEYDEYKPYWLQSDFEDDVWIIRLGKEDNILSWRDVILDDGEKLTSSKHQALLHSFKYWIVSLDNPLENGGKLLKKNTVTNALNRAIALINVILLNAESIKLSKLHLAGLSNDFVMGVMTSFAAENSISDGLYNYRARLCDFLKSQVSEVNSKDLDMFIKTYPYVNRSLLLEEKNLSLTHQERIRACCWMYRNGFYIKSTKSINYPNSRILAKQLFEGKVIGLDRIRFEALDDLYIDPPGTENEYRAIPVRDNSGIPSDMTIGAFISIFRTLTVVHNRTTASKPPINAFQNITTSRIHEHIKLRNVGRYLTLPATLIFTSIENAFTFCFDHIDSILNSTINIFANIPTSERVPTGQYKQIRYKGKATTFLSLWKEEKALSLIDQELFSLGIERLSIDQTNPNKYQDRRSNKGFLDLYDVLIGSIMILTGALTARRVDELVQLHPTGNLYPAISPSSDVGLNTDYSLIFRLKKSGFGGEHGQNHIEKRPIPHSIALLIYKLEKFNKKLIDQCNQKKGQLSLFNNIDAMKLKVKKVNADIYNDHLDAFCDYFETSCVQRESGELYRYYIRQHQLRRFFAMVFFWSKSFDGLDTLRWMLGHTDIEHLYHYVTEAQTGDVLNGVKASYLVDQLSARKLENIAELKHVLAKRYGISAANVSISTISEAISDFEDVNEYKTIPSMETMRQRETLERQVLELIEDDIVTLEPEFFIVEGVDGTHQDFNLILKVKELS